ncbi:YbbR-like domain-containing protein [Christiangramia sp. SM2212]|uniref:YbbR-like domain-containing protein n=1 Tax=Christiangramia sediminicola TaxID=3073267 RepID=A0ABU1EN21_9FLAO|nr:YbbR-like domain-containing protein [Christiangramia sp. SM2212]MDR5589786.1 YbbR-like domain-containing protein [Christiangramia sp. SM2212]
MPVRRKPRFKKSSVKTFSFFLIFSAIVWVLVQFSKTYTQLIEIPVSYTNAPLDKSISDQKPDHVDLQLQDNGFNIYYYKIFNPELIIDLSKARESEKQLVYTLQNHLTDIEQQLKIDFENSRIIQEEIVVPFQFKKEKMLKVIPNIEVNYAVGFSADDTIYLTPDSVKVSGPEKIIDSLVSVPTRSLSLSKINSDLDGIIDIDTSGLGELSFYENSVRYTQEVEKYTEGSAEIAVEVENVPDNLNLAYFPKTVVVYYQVNLKQFESISAADFRVVCNYKDIKEGDDYMIAQIVEKPESVNNIRLNERRIQFVIKR